MLLALFLLGGTTIKFFVLALLVGTLTGAYSSPFIATPVLVWLEKMRKKKN
jgi:preprotein translocase subunit SecF